ncbi:MULTISPECIES: ArsA family ATPase [unclassified Pseudodesulfovibrio]|uniref:ArsA family ATPase n=1 Tax=unclassified Pseudodesulfovibrio TaxID=2661612 RepID=UPI000FEB5F50|nr:MULTISPECIES: ArsA family ATPase [unclassified Pseudodesulfovibrio]MCJ2164817.1 ArsA family ATPase [Pseudodesulfovibrio sp. S3-i]RWU03812.1 ArsA family ATPase [Pseudodesulfovibrio sp. S3]
MSHQHYYFHAGKGGVGKSTTSTLSALHLANTGRRVLLVSLDPAHNQADIFDTDFTGKPIQVAPNLRVAQADIDKWIKHYLQGVEDQIRANYTYHAAFNLGKHLNVIKHSPGIEEYALLLAFQHYRTKFADADVIVFDMPPTALTTKFFNLPSLSLVWLEHLLALRCEIMEKKQIITKIKLGTKEFECDKITAKLDQQQSFFTELRDIFKDPLRSSINLVVNPDRLSFAEAERIDKTLEEMGMRLARIIMNKVSENSEWDTSSILMDRHAVCPIPLSSTPLIGQAALNDYLALHDRSFRFLDEQAHRA